ncbi:MAG: large subunit ribosomal protein L23 [Sphingobacteriales bacterium]|jgi:large subunit ribosomal protein L23
MQVLLKPILTEKMIGLGEKLGQYAFEVEKRADKLEIKTAVEDMYDVKVDSVRTTIYAGKRKSRNTKRGVIEGKTKSFKKAIVKLKEGDSIDFYSNI